MNDLRYAARQLRKTPGFTLVAVSSLAVGLALAAFTLATVNAYLLRSLPYPTAHRLYHLRYAAPGPWEPRGMTAINWKSLDDVVADSITSSGVTFHLMATGSLIGVRGLRVSPGFIRGLGVRAMIGRTFVEEEFETGSESVAIIGHELWRARFGSDPQIIGRQQKDVAVRMALGAERKHILRMLVAEACLICGAAFVAGLALTGITLRVLTPFIEAQLGRPAPAGPENQVYGVRPFDIATLVAACILMTAAGVSAIWWPARRASMRSPLAVLKEG